MTAPDGKTPRWVTSWPEWFGSEFAAQNVEVVPASDYDAAKRELAQTAAQLAAALAERDAAIRERDELRGRAIPAFAQLACICSGYRHGELTAAEFDYEAFRAELIADTLKLLDDMLPPISEPQAVAVERINRLAELARA